MRISELKRLGHGTMRGMLNYSEEVAVNGSNYLKCKINTGEEETLTINVFNKTVDKYLQSVYSNIKELPKTGTICEFELRYDGMNCGYDNFSILSFEVLRKGRTLNVVDVNVVKKKFRVILNTIKKENPDLAELIEMVYSDKRIKEKIFKAPFSENSGYNYICGNATQTLRLCYLCKSIATTYNEWDITGEKVNISLPLLYTASFLSNIGKTLTLDFDGEDIIKTYDGQLHNDMVLTMEIVTSYLEKSKLSDIQKSLLKHIIASSKENANFGNLETPRTREAVIFSLAEKMNSLMGAFETMDKDSVGEFYQIYQKTYCLDTYENI